MKNINQIFNNSEQYIEIIIHYSVNIFFSILILIIGRWLVKIISNILRKSLDKAKIDYTLSSFLVSASKMLLLAFVVISALGTLGINTASFTAVIAASGLAIGFALKDSLSNFASGIMIIFFKPFLKGDYVEISGIEGSVKSVTIFTTILNTPDNKTIIVPNNSITSNNIINYSKESTRRINLKFSISYNDSIKEAKEILSKILEEDSRILKEPKPIIAVSELGDSSVNIVCRPWVKTSDYWDVNFFLTEKVKIEFDKSGISIPFPQREIHLYHKNDT